MLRHQDQRGIATIEMIPLLMLFALLFNFMLGFFGIIHSGILNSIAARNYAFETFRHRANLTYLRDGAGQDGFNIADQINSRYTKRGLRFHGITSETQSGGQNWFVTRRPIRFTDISNAGSRSGSPAEHYTLVRSLANTGKVSLVFTGRTADDGRSGVDPVWIQSLYGICLNADCQKSN